MIVLQVYPEQLLGKIAKKAFATLGCSADEFFEVRKQQMTIFQTTTFWNKIDLSRQRHPP